MNFDIIRSDEMLGALGALGLATIAGLLTWAGTIGAGRTPVEVLGAGAVEGAERVAVNDERLGVVEVAESVGSGDVGTDAGSEADMVAPTLGEPSATAPAPAQPATKIERTAAPTRE